MGLAARAEGRMQPPGKRVRGGERCRRTALGDGPQGTREGSEANLRFNASSVLGCRAHLAVNGQVILGPQDISSCLNNSVSPKGLGTASNRGGTKLPMAGRPPVPGSPPAWEGRLSSWYLGRYPADRSPITPGSELSLPSSIRISPLSFQIGED